MIDNTKNLTTEEIETIPNKKPDFSSLFKNPVQVNDINTNYYNEEEPIK